MPGGPPKTELSSSPSSEAEPKVLNKAWVADQSIYGPCEDYLRTPNGRDCEPHPETILEETACPLS